MPLDDIANISISTSGGGLSLPGFGTPLILGGYSKAWAERVRTYTSLTDLSVDFAAGTPEYLAAAAIFSQNPRPSQVRVGRCAMKPTQGWSITPAASLPQVVTDFKVTIGGVVYTFTSDATPTVAEVVAGLVTALNAGTGIHGLTASNQGTGAYVGLVAALGAWQSVQVMDVNLLSIAQNHADPGLATDLAAIQLENPDWYAIVNPWNSKASILAIAAWAEANEKLFVAQSQDTEIIAVALGGAADVAKAVQTAAYARTAVLYDPNNGAFLDAGLLGRCLPEDPGSETWALKTISGVPARGYTGTHITNLKSKRCGWYYTVAGRNLSQEGKVGAGEWIDTVRGRDALKVDMQGRLLQRLADAKKVPYTDAGATIVQAEISASLDAFVKRGFISDGSVAITVPKVKDQSSTDRSNRYFPGITFTGTLAGAIHKLSIQGTLTP